MHDQTFSFWLFLRAARHGDTSWGSPAAVTHEAHLDTTRWGINDLKSARWKSEKGGNGQNFVCGASVEPSWSYLWVLLVFFLDTSLRVNRTSSVFSMCVLSVSQLPTTPNARFPSTFCSAGRRSRGFASSRWLLCRSGGAGDPDRPVFPPPPAAARRRCAAPKRPTAKNHPRWGKNHPERNI